MLAHRIPIHFDADPKKVILLYLDPGESERLPRFANFTRQLSEQEAVSLHQQTMSLFGHRHRYFNEIMLEHADRGLKELNNGTVLNEKQKLVFGSYLSKEYSVEAAALFNPSIVPHPDQTNLAPGETRFVLTLRSVGEGHISSIGFMEGIIDANQHIRFT